MPLRRKRFCASFASALGAARRVAQARRELVAACGVYARRALGMARRVAQAHRVLGMARRGAHARRVLGVALAIVAVACVTLAARSAWAQRVVLVRPVSSDSILNDAFNRLQAELRLQHFEVVVLHTEANDAIASTEIAAKEQAALAAVSLRSHRDAAMAELCIVDRATGKTTLRRLTLASVQDAPAVLAMRAVDLLRASLREFSPAEAPTPEIQDVVRGGNADVRRARDWARPAPSRVSARLSLAWFDAAARLSDAYGLEMQLDYAVLERLRVGVGLLGPLLGARYASPLGTARIRQEALPLRASYRLATSGRFELWPRLGFGIYHLDAHADVVAPYASKRDQVWAVFGELGLHGALRVVEAVTIEAGCGASLLGPRPAVAIAGYSETFRFAVIAASLGARAHF